MFLNKSCFSTIFSCRSFNIHLTDIFLKKILLKFFRRLYSYINLDFCNFIKCLPKCTIFYIKIFFLQTFFICLNYFSLSQIKYYLLFFYQQSLLLSIIVQSSTIQFGLCPRGGKLPKFPCIIMDNTF